MTKAEILALVPGRELDRLIAEKVFNCDPFTAPHYSTDIAAAWKIIEHMKTKNIPICVHTVEDGYDVHSFNEKTEKSIELFNIPSAPEGICKNALCAALDIWDIFEVYYDCNDKKWNVVIDKNHIGSFKTEREATDAYNNYMKSKE